MFKVSKEIDSFQASCIYTSMKRVKIRKEDTKNSLENEFLFHSKKENDDKIKKILDCGTWDDNLISEEQNANLHEELKML